MAARLLISATHGADDPERANLPFLVGTEALGAGRPVTVLLSANAVWLATPGYGEAIQYGGHPPVAVMVRRFLDAGGELAVCRDSTRPRSLTPADLVPEADVVDGAEIAERSAGAETLSL